MVREQKLHKMNKQFGGSFSEEADFRLSAGLLLAKKIQDLRFLQI
jgi:hypothetical protein